MLVPVNNFLFYSLYDRFSWTKNGLPLTIGGRITKSPTQGTLRFDPIKSEDDGYYRCLADNDHGTALSYDVLLKPACMLMILY